MPYEPSELAVILVVINLGCLTVLLVGNLVANELDIFGITIRRIETLNRRPDLVP